MTTAKKTRRVAYTTGNNYSGQRWEGQIHGGRAVRLPRKINRESFDSLCSKCKTQVLKALEQRASDHPVCESYQASYLRIKVYLDSGIWDNQLGYRYSDLDSGFERVMSELEMFTRADARFHDAALTRLRALTEGSKTNGD